MLYKMRVDDHIGNSVTVDSADATILIIGAASPGHRDIVSMFDLVYSENFGYFPAVLEGNSKKFAVVVKYIPHPTTSDPSLEILRTKSLMAGSVLVSEEYTLTVTNLAGLSAEGFPHPLRHAIQGTTYNNTPIAANILDHLTRDTTYTDTFDLPPDHVFLVSADVIGVSQSGAVAAFKLSAVVSSKSSAGYGLVGTVTTTTIADTSSSALAATIVADAAGGTFFKLQVTGHATDQVEWAGEVAVTMLKIAPPPA